MAEHHDLVAHMRRVQQAERDLRDLALVWRMIESSAAISCPVEVAPLLPTLADTRGRFDALQQRLVGALAEASRRQVGDELAAKAQCAIDILVRNLYERTADVGFLATDDTLRDFCTASSADRDTGRAALVARLAAYQATYTVYDDLALLAPDGGVLARLDEARPVGRVDAPWLGDVCARDGWTEHHGPSPLAADDGPALLYAHRIADAGGRTVGVLVLRFRLADELARIFERMADERGQIALVLVDPADRVVASSDPAHVPLGAGLRPLAPGEVSVTTFAGREYLAVQCDTRGYQGYQGPGWRARAMVSLLTAFAAAADDDADATVPLEDGALRRLQGDADAINRELRRVVWNGQLMARRQQGDSVRLKAVLGEVDRAGQRTRERVAVAVRDLHRASLRRARTHASQLAVLAADVLDRNLYERANDCRWWALSPALRTLLDAPPDAENAARIGGVLDHVNALYTVYSRLVVFDVDGRIRGLSRAGGCAVAVGDTVAPGWVEAAGRLDDPRQHAVTPFEDTPLHDAGPTLTYLAAITAPDGRRLGGIAIVFNARDEMAAMLRDVIGDRPGFAAFVDAGGRVLAGTDPGLGTAAVQRIAAGDSLVQHGEAHHACSRRAGAGYREYRNTGIDVVVGLRLGPVDRRGQGSTERSLVPQTVSARDERLELAVFQVGAGRYALPASTVLEALPREAIVRTPGRPDGALGLLEVATARGPRLVRVVCARSLFGVAYPPRASDGVVVVLVSAEGADHPALGLRVDEVLGITEVARSAWQPTPLGGEPARRVTGLVSCPVVSGADDGATVGSALVQLVDPGRLQPPGAWGGVPAPAAFTA